MAKDSITLEPHGVTEAGRYKVSTDSLTHKQADKLEKEVLKTCRDCPGMLGCQPNITRTRRPWTAKEDEIEVEGHTVFRPLIVPDKGNGWEEHDKCCGLTDLSLRSCY